MAAILTHANKEVSVTDASCVWNRRKEDDTRKQVLTVDELFPEKEVYVATNCIMDEEKKSRLFSKLNRAYGLHVGLSWLLFPEIPDSLVPLHNLEACLKSQELLDAVNKSFFLLDKVHLTQEKIDSIEKDTIGQSDNVSWLIIKRFLLTASNFNLVLKAIERKKYPPSLFKTLLGAYDISGLQAIKWGRENEETARKKFEDLYETKVRPCGIFMHESGVLGASPDGIIDEDCLLEIKCPWKWRECEDIWKALAEDKDYVIKYQENEYRVNTDHNYYHQIQGQLYMAKRKRCYLMIWTPKSSAVVAIEKDKEWGKNVQKLMDFYCNEFLTHVLMENS